MESGVFRFYFTIPFFCSKYCRITSVVSFGGSFEKKNYFSLPSCSQNCQISMML